ncbi:MAG: hypothetical protein RhofKO_08530 [Rhodothermales bacterium]
MNRIRAYTGHVPERIQVDNGSEFISKALDRWAYDHAVTLDFSRPGKPMDNPYTARLSTAVSQSTAAFATNV